MTFLLQKSIGYVLMSAILHLFHACCVVGCLGREPKQQRGPIQKKRPMKKIIARECGVGTGLSATRVGRRREAVGFVA
jgi:hypothetical protein